tara:strand:+ start:626 stop:841 length:216 start_codon:yes stop_codon:yes gene_type:complete
MPSIPATEIVDKLFSDKKDLSGEVNDAMMALSKDALDQRRQEIAKDWLKDSEPETEVTPEETPNETDNGTD